MRPTDPPTPAASGRRTAALVGLPFAVLAAVAAFLLMAHLIGGGAATPGAEASPAPTGSAASPGAAAAPSGPVPVPVTSLGERAAGVCRALVAALPQQLRDRERQPVTAGGERQNAAWGWPAITMACGAPGASPAPDAQLWLLDGVCWFSPDGAAWHTVDRAVPVTVALDAATGAAAGGQWVIELSAPIVATDPAAADPPSGCR